MENFLTTILHKEMAKVIIPSLRWDMKSDPEIWRKKCKDKLFELLGLDTFEKCYDDFKILYEDIVNERRHIKFLVQTEKGYYVPCHLLLPSIIKDKMSLCLCLQGHVSGAHLSMGIKKEEYDEVYLDEKEGLTFALQATDRGYAALCLEMRAFGECSGNEKDWGTNCDPCAMGALLLGRTLIGERVWDIQRVLDCVLKNFDFISMENSILMGESGGGTATYYTACFEDRFSVYVPIVALCDYKSSILAINHCKCNYIPHIMKYFDMGDLSLLIAPKKLVVVSATEDKWFPYQGALAEYERIHRIYEALEKGDNCTLVTQNSSHLFQPNAGWEAILNMLTKKAHK